MTSFVEKAQGVYIDPLTNAIGSIDREVERAAQNIAAYNKDIMDKVRAVTIKEAAVKASEMSIKLPIDKMEEFKDMPVPETKDLWKYRRFRKVKINKNEY